MRERHARPLERFLAELDDQNPDAFIARLARLVELMHDEDDAPPRWSSRA